MVNSTQIVLLIISGVLLLGYLIMTGINGKKYAAFVNRIDTKEHPLAPVYMIGCTVLDRIHFDLKSDASIKKIQKIAQINGKMYAEYYYYLMLVQRITIFYIGILGGAILATLSNNASVFLLGILLAGLMVYYYSEVFNDQLAEKRNHLISELPKVLSKMTLLINSGMILRDAWQMIAENGEGAFYQEMRTTTQDIRNGMIEERAYNRFAERCEIKEIRRFVSTITQNLQKGNAEMADSLNGMATEMWLERKSVARQKGEIANSKLILPMALIFVGILILIMVPMFSGISI